MNFFADVKAFMARTKQTDDTANLNSRLFELEQNRQPIVTYGDMATRSSGFVPVRHGQHLIPQVPTTSYNYDGTDTPFTPLGGPLL